MVRKHIQLMKRMAAKSIRSFELRKYQRFCRKNNQREYYIFNIPTHGNLGDQAIACAEERLFKKCKIKVFEIPSEHTNGYLNLLVKSIPSDAVILIHGGGFMGTTWTYEHNIAHKVIETLRNFKIIVFPQTYYFDDTKFGRELLESSMDIISRAKKITIFVREKYSYDFVSKSYKNAEVILVDDIVLSLKYVAKKKRSGALLCFRSDKEKKVNNAFFNIIRNIAKEEFGSVSQTDTVVRCAISPRRRWAEVNNKLKKFAACKIVITDRLHGMIFSIITKTPCVVLENQNYKIRGVFNRVKTKVSYIDLVSDYSEKEINNAISKVISMAEATSYRYDDSLIRKKLLESD